MKELERTKRVSISAVLFLLVVVIAVLTFKKPEYVFEKSAEETLEKIVEKDYIISQNDLEQMVVTDYEIIDIRSNYEYAKGHLDGAINISAINALEKESGSFLKELGDTGKKAILYGEHPDEANSAWMLLYQLGYENAMVLCIETSFVNNQFQVKDVNLEKPTVNYAKVLKSLMDKEPTVVKEKKKPKKVITAPKKKKRVPEGGC
ncbi:MAG: rhodanese-like domain-containing protein [Urechidicola sp.]|nr:rhodanese-like domain-containing protein [Urechidicola sp.]